VESWFGLDGSRDRAGSQPLFRDNSAQPGLGVDRLSLDPPLEMQVRSAGEFAGVSHQRNGFATGDQISLALQERGAVFVNRDAVATVLNDEGVAGFNGVRAEEHRPVVHRLNGGSFGGDQIDPEVPGPQIQLV